MEAKPKRPAPKDPYPVVLDLVGLLLGLLSAALLLRLRDLWAQSAVVVGPGLVLVVAVAVGQFVAAVQTYRRRMLWLCLAAPVALAVLLAFGAVDAGEPQMVWLTWFPLGFAAAIFIRRSAFET